MNEVPPLRLLPTVINGITPSRRKFRILTVLGAGDQPVTNLIEAFTYYDYALLGIVEMSVNKDGSFRIPSRRIDGTGIYQLVPY